MCEEGRVRVRETSGINLPDTAVMIVGHLLAWMAQNFAGEKK